VCPCSKRAYTYTRLRPSPLKKLGQKARPRLGSRPRALALFEELEPIDIMEEMAKCIEGEMDVEAEGIQDNVLKIEPKAKPKPKKAAGAREIETLNSDSR